MFNWLSFLLYAVVTAATPGPNNILSLSGASRLGLRRALPFNLGIWAGFSLVMLMCTFFCSTLSAVIPVLKTPMLVLGALYMLHLAYQTLKSDALAETAPARSGFFSGFILQFVNPKIYVYCMVSMEAYILPHYQGHWPALVFFALLLAFIGFLFTLCWAVFGSAFKFLFSKHAKATNAVMALLLVYCAVSLFL